MSTYAIGDVQGCALSLERLLEKLAFSPRHDRLWLVGDLVNRGAQSLQVLRWCHQHQHCVRAVLGNHDLHALAVASGARPASTHDTLQTLLSAADKNMLLDWLRSQPLIAQVGNSLLVHAGLLPQWTAKQALALGEEVSIALQNPDYGAFLSAMYGDTPNAWHDALGGIERLRVITNAMTRMRVCSLSGVIDLSFKGHPEAAPKGFMPWFAVPQRASQDTPIVCAHWSHLGLFVGHHIHALDSGCAWGGSLTALNLDTLEITQVTCAR